jgi:two-component SAPR family response regulator
LEQLAKQALALWKQPGEPDGEISQQRTEQAQSLCIQAFSLYNGAFLATDQALTWSVTRRERLRIRMQQLALTAGKFYEDNENWLSAIEMYHQGCDADPLEEAFCQRLMFCHQQLGNRSAGLTAYERCRAELAVHLGISPSTVTEALRKSLLG